MKKSCAWLATLTTLLSAGLLHAATDVALLPADVRGVILRADGATPVEKLAVKVWNAETEEVVFRTRTDADGVFMVPRLVEGDHYITAGPIRVDMRVLTARAGVTPQPHGFVLVMPKRLPLMTALLPSTLTAASVALPTSPEIVSP